MSLRWNFNNFRIMINRLNHIVLLCIFLMLNSCVINNPKVEDCQITNIKVTRITIGSSNDIVFHDDDTDFYYINRGLERGLNLDSLNAKVLNKTVTLHLPRLLLGTSEHIAQIAIGNDIIFTEFK